MTIRKAVLTTLALGATAAGLYCLRQKSLSHGATDDELYTSLPGDDLVPQPDHTSTRAISIAAAPGDVWPWLVQIGFERGGFYSYTVLENLIGLDIQNTDEIVEEWQRLQVGDEINLAPELALRVAELIPNQTLVLHGGDGPDDRHSDDDGQDMDMPFDFSWSFNLIPDGDGCRLVVRERYGYNESWAAVMVEPASMVSFLMSEKMLREIRDRAEAVAFSSPEHV